MASTDAHEPSDGFPSSVFDLAELGTLVEAHWPRLVQIVRRRLDSSLGARLDAEEIVNAAFLDARRKWAAYRNDRKLSPFVWLYRIVNDRLIEEWRTATRQKRDMRQNEPWPDRPSIDLGLRLVAPDTSPTQAVVRNEEAALMKQALGLLRKPDREVVMLRGYDELSFLEIGELLGIEENTATVRYVRALRRLKETWQRLTGESRQ
ncbi:MAG TPA: sigma-70 family RNA polymerase sigma factor [Gemmata sp.]|jgi:RNA polymerase sigma-70 factor (ECF subfamily)|nr:sigma-70 family RNA polymerase sigma factor [Gemmata sp.]